jgi:hypothetical protein
VRPDRGTEAWFLAARDRCVDHLRALASVRSAAENIQALLASSAGHSPEVAGALHSAAVTAYGQAFTEARTRRGKIRYRTRALKEAPGFDGRLHDHLIQLRNELIAHADYMHMPSVMDTQQIGDLRVSLTVKVKRLTGIHSRQLAERYLSHFRACADKLEELLNREVQELATEAAAHPAPFNATHNATPIYTAMTREFADLPAGNQVSDPEFEEDFAGYVYTVLTHTVPLVKTGKYRVRDSGGKEADVDIEVG